MHHLKNKKVLVPLVAIFAMLLTGAAVAFWTTSGGGSSTASVGTDAGVTITPITYSNSLFPGGSATVSFTVNNSSTTTAVTVASVVADTSAGTNGITGLPVGCAAADFHFANVAVGASIAASGTYAGTGTLSLDNTAVNQDACKGASPVLHLKVN